MESATKIESRSAVRQATGAIRILAKTISFVSRAAPVATASIGLLTTLAAVLPLAMAFAGKAIVDAVMAHDGHKALMWVAAELAAIGGQVVVQRAAGIMTQLLGERMLVHINFVILQKAASLELAQFEDGSFYDQLTRVRNESGYRPISVVSETFFLIQNTLTLIGYLVVIVPYRGWMGALLLGASLPVAFAEIWFSRSKYKMRFWQSPESRMIHYLEFVLSNDAYVKEVRLLGLAPFLLARFRHLSEALYLQGRRVSVRQLAWCSPLSLVSSFGFYFCYGILAFAAAASRITLGSMTLYVVAYRQAQQAFQSLLSAVGSVYEHTLYMSNLFDYLAIESRPHSAPQILPAPDRGELGVRFENVGFRYPRRGNNDEGESWAIRNVSFFVPKGQAVAIVGANGAGKTTLVKLLTRLYEPTEGRILLDGIDLQACDLQTLRSRFAVTFQDYQGFEFDIRENVGMGDVEHLGDDLQIRRAIERGGANEFVHKLQTGLETKLGRWAHDGIQLSGGQWQQLALSRTFMRETADVLILDEPTASLDAEAEHAVFERFRSLTENRTTFFISHRFSTVRMADRILVLEASQLIEDGSHADLLRAGAVYAKMFLLQSEAYQETGR